MSFLEQDFRIRGATKKEVIVDFLKEVKLLRKYRRSTRKAKTDAEKQLYEMLTDFHGNWAQILLFRINLYDAILKAEVS